MKYSKSLRFLVLRGMSAAGLLTAVTSCSFDSGPTPPPGKLALSPEQRGVSTRNLDQLKAVIETLQSSIGAYPPKFKDEHEKHKIYELWSDAYADAKVFEARAGSAERVLWTIAELARQGHNLDVDKSGLIAQDRIEKCLSLFPRSLHCHFSSMDYYLSIKVTNDALANAKRSIDFLQKRLAPKVNEHVEESLVYYYAYDEQMTKSVKQIDRYVRLFPRSEKKAKLLAMKAELRKQLAGTK